jgi:5-methyltetrahydrofolate--homocysteine methyltransferase
MHEHRRNQLYDALASRILIIDGAMGTMLQAYNPTLADFGGAGLENCNENLNVTRPEWIADIHRAYFKAGADIVETNSFQGSPIVLAEFNIPDRAHELNFLAAKIAARRPMNFRRRPNPAS